MNGNGIDMYDLVILSDHDETQLIPLYKNIWIGVIEKLNPSPPVPRRRTSCYCRCPVYLYQNRKVFGMVSNYNTGEMNYYYIPDNELIFIE